MTATGRHLAAVATALLLTAGFLALGSWQLQRRAWKLELIERVAQRLDAAPVDAPSPERWNSIGAATDEYRRVRVAGQYLQGRDTLVHAATELGSGYWVLSPLRMADGSLVLINRGFATPEQARRRAVAAPEGEHSVTGLLRLSEPGSGLLGRLRRNAPAGARWYWRDVAAIAAAAGLERVAPYFIDADAASTSPPPVGGLTVVDFRNNHLAYALTWYALALMAAAGAWRLLRDARR